MIEISFKTDHPAFDQAPGREAAQILRQIADKIETEQHYADGEVRDAQGDHIGPWAASLAIPDDEKD